MSSPLADGLNELITDLRSNWGTFDLSSVSSTHRVVAAESATIPPGSLLPFLYLAYDSAADRYGDAPLGEYDDAGEIGFIGFLASSSSDPSTRYLDGVSFADEFRQKVRAAHQDSANTTLYGFLGFLVRIDGIESDSVEVPQGFVIVHGSISYRRITQAQV